MRQFDILNVVDVESTCWEKNSPNGMVGEIIEVGITPYHIRQGTVGERDSWMIKPEKSTVSEFCTSLTGITQEDVDEDGLPFAEVCDALRKEYKTNLRPWGSWGEYDRRMLNNEARAKKCGFPFSPYHLNIKLLFSLFFGLGKQIGLMEGVHKSRLQFDGDQHKAEDDAYNTAKVLEVVNRCFRKGHGI